MSVPAAGSAPEAELAAFRAKLLELRAQTGSPSLRVLETLAQAFGGRLPKSSIRDKLRGKTMPDLDFVLTFVRACLLYAEKMGRLVPIPMADMKAWEDAQLAVVRAFDQARIDRSVAEWTDRELRRHSTGVWVTPRQLPPASRHFVGRAAEREALTRLLDEDGAASTAVVSGAAGIGKTALALHWAHQMIGRFPDGQLFLNLRGFGPAAEPVTPNEAVRRFLDALEVDPRRIPTDLDSQTDLYRSLVAGRRMLIVLDNARDSAQVRPLLPGAPGCLVLVTSRNRLSGLVAADSAHPLSLDLLPQPEAEALLARRIGSDRVTAEPNAVKEIITACAGLPLALSIVAAHVADRPHWTMATLATQLREISSRLDVLSSGEDVYTDMRAVLSWSYDALTPDAARLLRLLGLHPGQDISASAAASLAGVRLAEVQELLANLTRANLIIEHTQGRYTFHDLLRAYAHQLAHTHDDSQQRHDAIHQILDYYLHAAHTAARMLNPTRDAIPLGLSPARPGVAIEHFTDHQQAIDWFTAERPVLLAAVDHAASTGFDNHTWQIAWTLVNFLDRQGHWHDLARTQSAALAAAHRLADLPAQARALLNLVRADVRLARYDDAHTHLRHALDLYQQTDDAIGQAHTHHTLAQLWEQQGNYFEALHHAGQALGLFRAADHRVGQAHALNWVGWCHTLLGEHQHAITYCQQALSLFQTLGERDGQAATWDSLGHAHHHLGHHTEAIDCYQHAVDLYRDLGDRYNQADTLIQLGETHQSIGNTKAARDAWQQTLIILEELDHPDAKSVRARLAALGPTNGQPNRTAS